MEIRIETDGEVGHTRLYMNGREVQDWKEFSIGASLLKTGSGVKMQLVKVSPDHPGMDCLSYYRGDFAKMDDLEKRNDRENGK